ncbi:hypothetical protein M422DRAFT_270241 [Sphaerobolus stellatus SS14]|uniref:Helicase ATP-binding domain-containing protein n=1 Tax=Sphaerobolus stellatus (strain SS14) TaxID=990650 RepID=A0A0C9UT28_SPHS4|nr:hypothetical protein M422DRAFT_270241 [Sphaerobolus stellatus SS14]
MRDVINVAEQIYGYRAKTFQIRVAEKILEGKDVLAIASTGARRSHIFSLVAIAAALSGQDGLVIVICPLKALQMDQVHRLSEAHEHLVEKNLPVIKAVAINEENHDDAAFAELAKNDTRICYATPKHSCAVTALSNSSAHRSFETGSLPSCWMRCMSFIFELRLEWRSVLFGGLTWEATVRMYANGFILWSIQL